jgi:hypothetical protein
MSLKSARLIFYTTDVRSLNKCTVCSKQILEERTTCLILLFCMGENLNARGEKISSVLKDYALWPQKLCTAGPLFVMLYTQDCKQQAVKENEDQL